MCVIRGFSSIVQTIILPLSESTAFSRALELLRAGEIVALPTDTVYGIMADGYNADAIEKLFVAKDRPSHKAIQLLIADASDLERVAAHVSTDARRLAETFFPGGLTLIVEARADLPKNLRADTNTIGVRLPDAPLVRELARALGRPLAATSANRSGGANPRTAQDALKDLDGRIALIVLFWIAPLSRRAYCARAQSRRMKSKRCWAFRSIIHKEGRHDRP
ncbi:MAG: threonylcarbamoyl-AMP synthase [Chloroflexi bacterium]|nr:MAG: threonylcarbamoyl-AMP synthase [Chloroflexota bacterium]